MQGDLDSERGHCHAAAALLVGLLHCQQRGRLQERLRLKAQLQPRLPHCRLTLVWQV